MDQKAASAESIRRLNQTMNRRFEEQNKLVCDMMAELSSVSAKVEKAQDEARSQPVEGMQRLSQTVDRRLDMQNLHIRMSMIAFNELSSEVKEMRSEIAALKLQNEQLHQQVADLIKRLDDSKQK